MISEHQFATHYSSVWKSVTPLADGFWGKENLLTDRIDPPLDDLAPKSMRAAINEAAFRAFCILHGRPGHATDSEVLVALDNEVASVISYVERFSSRSEINTADFNDACRQEGLHLVRRLLRFFPRNQPTVLRPAFNGCGLLSACEGDVIEGSCLYEIKAGDRGFRSIDVRQLLIYTALAYANGSLKFTDIGLYNPRTGVSWRRSLEAVSHAVSGLKLNDVLASLVEQFTNASASR